ncbi:MAG: UDP-N-acetylmuramate--L-alanine ligase, partial [Proteobacteria bacterium]
MLAENTHVHLIGIGGIGVSAVARALLQLGYRVSGSDVRQSQLTLALRAEGATVHIG